MTVIGKDISRKQIKSKVRILSTYQALSMKFNEEKVSKLEFARQAMLESLAMNRNPLMELINFFFFTKDLSNPIKLTALVLGIMGSDRKS